MLCQSEYDEAVITTRVDAKVRRRATDCLLIMLQMTPVISTTKTTGAILVSTKKVAAVDDRSTKPIHAYVNQ